MFSANTVDLYEDTDSGYREVSVILYADPMPEQLVVRDFTGYYLNQVGFNGYADEQDDAGNFVTMICVHAKFGININPDYHAAVRALLGERLWTMFSEQVYESDYDRTQKGQVNITRLTHEESARMLELIANHSTFVS